MASKIKEHIAKLPKKRQDKIKKLAAELVYEELSLQSLRMAIGKSQRKIGSKLHINQAAVSKLERRADMYVSTLRDYIEAMGGELDIVARFPNNPPIHINQFHDAR